MRDDAGSCGGRLHLRALEKVRTHRTEIKILVATAALLLLPFIIVFLEQAAAHSVRYLLQHGLRRSSMSLQRRWFNARAFVTCSGVANPALCFRSAAAVARDSEVSWGASVAASCCRACTTNERTRSCSKHVTVREGGGLQPRANLPVLVPSKAVIKI